MFNLRQLILVLFSTLSLAACSGLKSATTSSSSTSPSTTGLSGVVSAGPIQNSTVTAYALNSDGSQGSQLGTSTTDSTGSFVLAVSKQTGPVMIVATGGTYTEEASGSSVSVGSAQIRAVLSSTSEGQEVGVTPITEIASQRAIAVILANGSVAPAEIINSANTTVATAMGLTDITKPPANPTLSASSASNTDAAQYALALAAMSQMAHSASTGLSKTINSLDLAQALATSFTYNESFSTSVGAVDVPVPNTQGATLSLNAVLTAAGGTSFSKAMQVATATYGSTPTAINLGYNNSSVVPTPTYVTAPPPPSGAPTVSAPQPPPVLPSSQPTIAGPPATPPSAPIMGMAIAGTSSTSAIVSFTAPVSNGSSPILLYTVTASPGGLTGTGTASPIQVSGLTLGTSYTFTVRAANAIGVSAPSAPSGSFSSKTVPGAPTIGIAVAGTAGASVAFTAPVNTGGLAITGYTVTSSPGSVTVSGTSSPILVSGLTNGLTYTFTVKASNSLGIGGPSSASNSVTPAGLPGAPTIGTATAGTSSALVTFTAPSGTGGAAITGYTVLSSPGGISASGSSSPITVSGLTSGTSYTFTVRATNAAGTGLASAASNSVTPSAGSSAPSAPTIGLASVAGTGSASIAFTASASSGGSAITSYTVTSSPGGLTASGSTASAITLSGLTMGTAYTFSVTATNAVGTSAPSAASNSVTPAGLPGAPIIGTATAGSASASVAFTAPTNFGSPITSYIVTSSPGSISASGTASPISVSGLTIGTAYTFTVKATNAIGQGPASSASNSVTPTTGATPPSAPTIGVAALAGSASASVSFMAPASNGGSPVTSYTVTSSPGGLTASGTAASPLTVSGLTGGTSYTFTVTATNAIGTGVASAVSNSVTPASVPGAPTIGVATAGSTSATIAFTAPASNGGSAITSYTATSSPGGLTASSGSSPIHITGLTGGTAYTFTVKATNVAGTGLASSASNSVTPTGASVPGAPTIGVATAGSGSASVAFTAPASTGSSAITSYLVTSSPGTISASGSSSPITVAGLSNGTAYTFTVKALNTAGYGSASAASNSVTPNPPATVPGAPTMGVAALAGTASATVAFTAPASNGGSAITSYLITSSPGGVTASGTTASVIVNGLTTGTAYTFTVKAINAVGTSAASLASASITPGPLWASAKMIADSETRAVTTDPSGNVYTAGTTYAALDSNTLTGTSDFYVAKYNASGVKQWIVQLGGSAAYTTAYSVAVDSAKNVYVSGQTAGDLDGNALVGNYDLFLVKYNSSGVKQWTRTLGAASAESNAMRVGVDSSDNVYISGYTEGGLDGNSLTGTRDYFVAKYNSSGTKQWFHQAGVSGVGMSVWGMAVDASGNTFLSGGTAGALDGNTLTGTTDVFLVKYNASGVRQWTQQYGIAATAAWGSGVALDPSGNIYVGGATQGGLESNTLVGTQDLFVTKFNSAGARQWTRQLGVASAQVFVNEIAVDSLGNAYVSGNTDGALDGNTLASASSAVFVTKYNTSGTKQWTKLDGNTTVVTGTDTMGSGVAVDPSGNIFVGGWSADTNFAGTGSAGAFVSKYNPAGTRQ